MTREVLEGIRSRFEKYLDWSDVERRKFFETWQDKRDLHDLIEVADAAIKNQGAPTEAETTMRVLAAAMAEQAMDRALGLEVGKRNALVRENTALKQRVAELEAVEAAQKLQAVGGLVQEYVKRLRVEAQGVCMCPPSEIKSTSYVCLSCCAKAELRRRGLSGL